MHQAILSVLACTAREFGVRPATAATILEPWKENVAA